MKFDWNKNNSLQHYRSAVRRIEDADYLDIDTCDIDYDLAARGDVERFIDDYADTEREEIAALDARFKRALWRMLRRSKHEQWYRDAGKHFPDAWWWNVPFDSAQGDGQ